MSTATGPLSLPRTAQDCLLKIPEVASELRVSRAMAFRLVSGGPKCDAVLASVRVGRRILVRRRTLDEFIAKAETVKSRA